MSFQLLLENWATTEQQLNNNNFQSFNVSNIAVATSLCSKSNKLLVVCFSDKIVFVSGSVCFYPEVGFDGGLHWWSDEGQAVSVRRSETRLE